MQEAFKNYYRHYSPLQKERDTMSRLNIGSEPDLRDFLVDATAEELDWAEDEKGQRSGFTILDFPPVTLRFYPERNARYDAWYGQWLQWSEGCKQAHTFRMHSYEPCVINYYKVLGIEPSATDEEIRSAYRELALRLHPDKNRQKDLEWLDKELWNATVEAYEVLGDKENRKKYDEIYDKEVTRLTLLNKHFPRKTSSPMLQKYVAFLAGSCLLGLWYWYYTRKQEVVIPLYEKAQPELFDCG